MFSQVVDEVVTNVFPVCCMFILITHIARFGRRVPYAFWKFENWRVGVDLGPLGVLYLIATEVALYCPLIRNM